PGEGGGWGREKRVGVMRAYAAFTSTAFASRSPTCEVVSEPPRSGVVRPSRSERATAASTAWAADLWPRESSIIAAERTAPPGVARARAASAGAEPWTGSNIEVWPGLRLAEAAT